MALDPRTIDPSGVAPVTDPSVVGGAADASPTTLVLQYLKQRGYTPSSENVRRALEANQRDPGVIPGLRSDTGATEAQDQAAMRAAGVGAPRGGGSGRTSAAPARPGVPVAPSDDTFFPNAPPGTVPGAPSNDTFFPNGQPTPSAAGKPGAKPAASAPAAQVAAPAPVLPPPSDDTFLPNQPPAPAPAAAAPASGAPGLGVVLPRIGNDIVSGTNSVMDRIRSMIAQRPPSAAPAPAPTESPGPPTPLPWVVRELMDQSRRSNVNPAPGEPTTMTPSQIYGGVPPLNPAQPQPPPPVSLPGPGTLNAGISRAVGDPVAPPAPVVPMPPPPVVASPPPAEPAVMEARNTRRPRRSLFASR